MKIIFVIPSIGTSGGIDVVYKYAELLSQRGHDVCVYKELYFSNMHRYPSAVKNFAHQVYCTLKAMIQKNKYAHSIDKYVWKINDKTIGNPDVIIATAWPTAYRVNKLSSRKAKKYYFIQDFEIWDNEELALKTYELPLKKIVISTWINKQMNNELGIGPFPVVMNGIDTDVFYDQKIRDKNKIVFLMLNHTLEKKGVKYGISAFEKIREKFPNSKLIMFGMCDRKNLPNYVEYYRNPSREALIDLYCSANYFLFPSIDEGWGLTPIEAMACGCIVFGTNTGFVLDLGIHRENMMISEPGDVDGMVNNIEFVLNNRNIEDVIRKNGKNTIDNLNWNRSLNRLLQLLEG